MSKLYYDCPIEAAYMTKNFSVKYYPDSFDVVCKDCSKEYQQRYYTLHYYIAYESHSIFEPREGDLVETCGEVGEVQWNSRLYIEQNNGESRIYLQDVSDVEIIQRNGKPFFTPKVVR